MSFRDLLVLVDQGRNGRERVDLAARIARDFEAHLTGLYVGVPLPLQLAVLSELPVEVSEMHERASREAAEGAEALFRERMAAAEPTLSAEWRSAEGDPGEVASLHARYADLAIVGQADPDGSAPGTTPDLPERVILGAGRPALVVPYVGRFESVGRRVLVAWNASREATRAVNDALPFLKRAARVTVLSVNPRSGVDAHGAIPGADIALHLARHDVTVEAATVATDDVRVDDMLLSQASDMEADLIVMGAYGHSRLGELVLGGATRHLLRQITVPVFMSH
jgi:nucleotide-binding universal stress UspA family protein